MTPTNDTPWWDQPKQEETPWWDTPKPPENTWWDSSDKKTIYNEGKSNKIATENAANTLLEQVSAPSEKETENTEKSDEKTTNGSIFNILQSWAQHNIHTLVYTLIGLLGGIGILTLGFWKTFLIALCLSIGYLLGSVQDGNPHLMQKLKSFSRKFLDNNPFLHKD